MFQNILTPPPPPKKKSFIPDFSVQTKMQQWITMTADDATMNIIILIPIFPSWNHLERILNSFISYSWRCKFTYGFSTGIPRNILFIYGKDQNLANYIIFLIIEFCKN